MTWIILLMGAAAIGAGLAMCCKPPLMGPYEDDEDDE